MAFGVVATPSIVDPHVVTDSPAQLLQPLMEGCEARLSFSIIGDGIHEHADPPHPLRLLRTRRERPRRRAAKRDNELPPSDIDCHVTLPWGSCNGGNDITPGRAALRDFKPAYDCSGSKAAFSARRTNVRSASKSGAKVDVACHVQTYPEC